VQIRGVRHGVMYILLSQCANLASNSNTFLFSINVVLDLHHTKSSASRLSPAIAYLPTLSSIPRGSSAFGVPPVIASSCRRLVVNRSSRRSLPSAQDASSHSSRSQTTISTRCVAAAIPPAMSALKTSRATKPPSNTMTL
jgi:hypothetical protein